VSSLHIPGPFRRVVSADNVIEPIDIVRARALVADLFAGSRKRYLVDMLLSWAVGAFAFVALVILPPWSVGWFAALVPCVLAFYRAMGFVHELAHQRSDAFRPIRFLWNALCGVPFLLPSFLYDDHAHHHSRARYGTARDGEYVPWGHMPLRAMFLCLLVSFLAPWLAVVRFLVLFPVSLTSNKLRDIVFTRASSLTLHGGHVRELPTRREQWRWRLQEAMCFAYVCGMATLVATRYLPLRVVLTEFAVLAIVSGLNSIRILGAHRYRGTGEPMSFHGQILDSVNYPYGGIVTTLWAPVGLQFHALHHLFPALPYHALDEAHRRLVQGLPAHSAYHDTISIGLLATLSQQRHERRAQRDICDLWHDEQQLGG
jgi:fatty acid desaturase